jgi:eukaryotic-like serine/threonine-protein kinase
VGNSVDPGAALLRELALPDRYELLRHIANGGMASVWCAEDRLLGRRVAIKLLAEPFAHDPAAVRRFKREARVAARLAGHPNVVTIYDVGEAPAPDGGPGRPFIVMEYLPGGTVADALRVGAASRNEALRWLHEAAAALDYAHAKGVLHRDVKLVNLLLDCDRLLHVADFGIAHLGSEDTLTATGQFLGTAAYLAPERALGQAATAASDRYSLAVAAFELLVGQRPFTAGHFAAQARQHIEDPPPRASRLNPALPAEIDAVLSRGMAKTPESRWPTAGAFADALEAALTETAVSHAVPRRRRAPRSIPAAVPTRRQARPTGRAVAVAALAAATLGVGLAAGAIDFHGTPTRAHASVRAQRPSARHLAALPSTKAPRKAPIRQVAGTPAAARVPPPTADTLEARGHALMTQGNYAAAIPVLHQAVSAASPGSLTYAYALFDLGRSLRLAGDPQAAVPILWQRLQIPNQTDVVRTELQLALRALGRRYRSSGGASPGAPDNGHGANGGSNGGNGGSNGSD